MAKDLFDLTGRVAIVTGAGMGLGEAMAKGLAQFGAAVVCADVNGEAAQGVARSIQETGGDALAIRCDVSQAADIAELVTQSLATFQRIDVLVNNAGTSIHIPAEDMPLEEWDRIIGVNVRGLFLCCQAVGRVMLEQGSGSIINISSIGGEVALGRGNAAFCASKGAVGNLTRELAIEWGPRGIRVNAIAPCQFRSPGLEKVLSEPIFDPDKLMATWLANIPLGRIGEPGELVGPVVFLASDASCMVTGHVLAVDGGYLAR